jgi:hypothetical protein
VTITIHRALGNAYSGVMARSQKQLLGRPRYTVNQNGAPEPETNEGTITIGRQSGEKTDKVDAAEKPAAKSPARS